MIVLGLGYIGSLLDTYCEGSWKVIEILGVIEGHGRSWKVNEGQRRSRKVMDGLFPSLD